METSGASSRSKRLDGSFEPGSQDPAEGRSERSAESGASRLSVPAPWWIRVVPFFLSAFFFLSAVFAIFAPLPLLVLRFRSGRPWAWLAILTNSAIVALAGGRLSLGLYGVTVGVLSLLMGELVARRQSLERIAVISLLGMAIAGGALLGWYSHLHHVNPVAEFRQEVSQVVDYLEKSVSKGATWDAADSAEWKEGLLLEFPSAIAVFALILVWANLTALLRVNPEGIRERIGLDAGFVRNWKVPDWLVWPTIVSGFFLVVDVGPGSLFAINVFRFLMAIYAIQGLSILSFFFDVWNVRGMFRVFGFLTSIFLMMPLLLSLGFFDLWFDFRSKFRQV